MNWIRFSYMAETVILAALGITVGLFVIRFIS